MTLDNSICLKLSLQRALLGEVTDNLKAVTAGWSGATAVIHFYFKEVVTNKERETASVVSAEVIADFSDEFTVEEECFDWTQTKIDVLDFYVYLSK